MCFCIKSSIGTHGASYKSALNPPVVCSTDCSKAVVPVLVLLFVALWFILRGDLLYVFPCVILFLCFSVLLVLRLPRLGKRELILVLFVRLFDLCLFEFVVFLFLLESGKGCGLLLWHSMVQVLFRFLWDQWAYCGVFENGVLFVNTLEGVALLQTKLLLMKSLYKTETAILYFLVRLCLFGFVGLLFLLVSEKGCDCGTPWTFLLLFFFFISKGIFYVYSPK